MASLVSHSTPRRATLQITREVNEWMKRGDIREFSRDTKLEDEMKGAAFLAFVSVSFKEGHSIGSSFSGKPHKQL